MRENQIGDAPMSYAVPVHAVPLTVPDEMRIHTEVVAQIQHVDIVVCSHIGDQEVRFYDVIARCLSEELHVARNTAALHLAGYGQRRQPEKQGLLGQGSIEPVEQFLRGHSTGVMK